MVMQKVAFVSVRYAVPDDDIWNTASILPCGKRAMPDVNLTLLPSSPPVRVTVHRRHAWSTVTAILQPGRLREVETDQGFYLIQQTVVSFCCRNMAKSARSKSKKEFRNIKKYDQHIAYCSHGCGG